MLRHPEERSSWTDDRSEGFRMAAVVLAISLLLATLGGIGIASPERLLALIRRVQNPTGLYGIAGLRLILGVALLRIAPTSKAPDVLQVFGVIALIAGLATPLIGLERFGKVIDWWWGQGIPVIRIWAALPIALGLYLAWAVAP
jgi:hypothetical protein